MACLTAGRLAELEKNVDFHYDQVMNAAVSKADIESCQFGLLKIVFGSVVGVTLGAYNGIRSLSLVSSRMGKMTMLLGNTLAGAYLGFILGANYSTSHFGWIQKETNQVAPEEPLSGFATKLQNFLIARYDLRSAKGINYLMNGVQKEMVGIDEEETKLRRELANVHLPSNFNNLRPVSGKKVVESLNRDSNK